MGNHFKASCSSWTKRIWILVSAVIFLVGSTTGAVGQSNDGIESQVKENAWLAEKIRSDKAAIPNDERGHAESDERLFEIEERIGDRALVHAFDAVELDIGGFLTQALTVISGDENTEYSPNLTQLEILVRATVAEDWTVFAALGFLREADVDLSDTENPTFRGSANRVPNIISWMNYHVSDAFEIRAGRFVTPHGIINIEHFPPSLLEINQPQFLRPFSGATIFPNFLNGVQTHGKFFVGERKSNTIEYAAYAGFSNPSPDKVLAGGRLAYGHSHSGLKFGVNYGHGSREGVPAGALGSFSAVPARSIRSNSYETVGADVLFDKGRFFWKTEAFYSFENGDADRWTIYTQPSIRLDDKWIGFYRFDLFDPGQGLKQVSEHVIGMNYLPFPVIRLRGAVFLRDFDNGGDDVVVGQLSATVSF